MLATRALLRVLFTTSAFTLACGSDSPAPADEVDAITLSDAAADGSVEAPDSDPARRDVRTDARVPPDVQELPPDGATDGATDSGPDDDIEDTTTEVDADDCAASSECRGGEICDDGRCREVCSAANPCDGALAVCDIDTGLCVACLQNADCRGGEICDDQQCIPFGSETCRPQDERCDGNTRFYCSDGELVSEVCPAETLCRTDEARSPVCGSRVCVPNAVGCDGDNATVCNADGSDFSVIPCLGSQTCNEGLCIPRPCVVGSQTCDEQIAVVCEEDAVESRTDCNACDDGEFGCNCVEGSCVARVCEPDSPRCAGTGTQTCRADGGGYEAVVACADGQSCRSGICIDDQCDVGRRLCIDGDIFVCAGDPSEYVLQENCSSTTTCVDATCRPHICVPDSITCDGDTLVTCLSTGLARRRTDCSTTGEICDEETASCIPLVCEPGTGTVCQGDSVVQCNDEGTGYDTLRECEDGGCTSGLCDSDCEGRDDLLGCRFVAGDFEQRPEECTFGSCGGDALCMNGSCTNVSGRAQSALVVHNPSGESVTVRVRSQRLDSSVTETVSPGAFLRILLAPGSDSAGSQLSDRAFILTSERPVAVWQEGPAIRTGREGSTDISRLIPVSRLGQSHVSVGYPSDMETRTSSRQTHTVIADQPSVTTQVYTYGQAVARGNAFTTIGPNTSRDIPHGSAIILSLVPDDDAGDVSGLRITTDAPVAMFASYGCANIPVDVDFCDHLFEQVPPLDVAGGTSFVIAKSPDRGTEDDIIRITATHPARTTSVSVTPYRGGTTGTTEFTLAPGETHELLANQGFQLSATDPVIVHQYLVSGNYSAEGDSCYPGGIFGPRSGCAIPPDCDENYGQGDPSMAIVVPVERWSDSHYAFIPADFGDAVFTVSRPSDEPIRIDGVVATDGRITARLPDIDIVQFDADPGVHLLESDEHFNILVTSYTCRSSYAYGGEFR